MTDGRAPIDSFQDPISATRHTSALAAAKAKFKAGDIAGAYNETRAILREDRHNGPAHLLMAQLAVHREAYSNATTLLQIAMHLDGRSADALALQAICDLRSGHIEDCVVHAQAALELPSAFAETYDLLGEIFHTLADYARSVKALEYAAVLDAENTKVQTNLAAALGLCGRADEALAILDAVITKAPRNAKALGLRSELGQATVEKNDIDQINQLLPTLSSAFERLQLVHALARQTEDLGAPQEGFQLLCDGKAAFVISVPEVDDTTDQTMFNTLEAICARTTGRTERPLGPIFVGGMPRSGTTLLERILTNGTGLKSIGESHRLAALAKQYSHSDSPRLIDTECLSEAWSYLPFTDIGSAYQAYGRALVGANRFLDKMPLNVLLTPLVVSALPEARIVCTLRHPLDTLVGNFRQHFEYGSGTYDYSLSLVRTAAYIARFHQYARDLARHYPEQVLLVEYEALVNEPQEIGRLVFDFCGLAWSDSATAIHLNAAPIGSASATQVRVPIHKNYLARWKAYDAFLEPAKAVLDAYGCRWRDTD